MGTTNPLGSVTSSTSLATYCLLLPGKRLHLSALLFERKFRGRGNKTAALEALHQLEAAGLGKLEKEKSHRGTTAVSISSWFTSQSCCSLGFIISGVHPTSPSFFTIWDCQERQYSHGHEWHTVYIIFHVLCLLADIHFHQGGSWQWKTGGAGRETSPVWCNAIPIPVYPAARGDCCKVSIQARS